MARRVALGRRKEGPHRSSSNTCPSGARIVSPPALMAMMLRVGRDSGNRRSTHASSAGAAASIAPPHRRRQRPPWQAAASPPGPSLPSAPCRLRPVSSARPSLPSLAVLPALPCPAFPAFPAAAPAGSARPDKPPLSTADTLTPRMTSHDQLRLLNFLGHFLISSWCSCTETVLAPPL